LDAPLPQKRPETPGYKGTLIHLESTHPRPLTSVDSKPLTRILTPLDATLTKTTGEGKGVIVN
jgi:hypothetical protein